MAVEHVERKLAAIVAADVAGYSRLTGADEEGTMRRLRALRAELIDPAIQAHRGHIVKTMGDGFLVEFSSVVYPPLTTIHQDMEEQGKIGVEVLLDILKAPNRDLHAAPSHRRVEPRLVVRGSTMPPRK